MLTGNFSEGVDKQGRKKTKLNVSAVDASSHARTVHSCCIDAAMAAIVSFAATNDAPILCGGSVEGLSELLEAAEYCDIGGLCVQRLRRSSLPTLQSFFMRRAVCWSLCGECSL